MNQQLFSLAMARTSQIQCNDDDYDNVSFVLDQCTDLDLSSASSPKEESEEYTCRSSLTQYPDSGPTSRCSFS